MGLGGNLATINDASENAWIISQFSQFGATNRHLWIGLVDPDRATNDGNRNNRITEFRWISGQTPAYVNWSPVEPNNSGTAEYHTMIWSQTDFYKGRWNDANGSDTVLLGQLIHGVVEVEPAKLPIVTTDPEVQRLSAPVKISQLVGDYDRHLQQPTENLTAQRFGLTNTDLGVPFLHKGKTYVAFGDVWLDNRDPLGWSEDTNLEDGLALNFNTNATGQWQPIVIPNTAQGAFAVPAEGVSISNVMYLWHTTDSIPGTMGRSVLARSTNDGQSFVLLRNFSTGYFINISAVERNASEWPGSPRTGEPLLYVFGAGAYRRSDVHLACIPSAEIENPNAIRYFRGLSNGVPQWTATETDARAVIDHPVVGEFSVSFDEHLARWLMLYNSGSPRGIILRTAINPWGPWSEPRVIFEPTIDGGYCNFIHRSWTLPHCDTAYDPGRENEWGGEYGPFQFEHLARTVNGQRRIYFTMSTWNPYTVVLMKVDLAREPVIASNLPRLEVPIIGSTNLIFHWPAPSHGWFLEFSPSLSVTGQFQRSTYTPVIAGDKIQAGVEKRLGFYRLGRP